MPAASLSSGLLVVVVIGLIGRGDVDDRAGQKLPHLLAQSLDVPLLLLAVEMQLLE
jgi:hypothetical protein